MGIQVEKIQDFCKADWADSLIFKRAMKEETLRRGLSYTGKVEDSEDESNVSDPVGSPVTSALVSPKAQNLEANTQDPDSSML